MPRKCRCIPNPSPSFNAHEGSSLFSVDSGGKEEGVTPEKLFHELLGLGLNWKVTECEFDSESGVVRLRIEETEHLWKVKRSPDEGSEAACYDHTEEMVWRHLNVFEHKCEIGCRLPRARYIKTQKVYPLCPSSTFL